MAKASTGAAEASESVASRPPRETGKAGHRAKASRDRPFQGQQPRAARGGTTENVVPCTTLLKQWKIGLRWQSTARGNASRTSGAMWLKRRGAHTPGKRDDVTQGVTHRAATARRDRTSPWHVSADSARDDARARSAPQRSAGWTSPRAPARGGHSAGPRWKIGVCNRGCVGSSNRSLQQIFSLAHMGFDRDAALLRPDVMSPVCLRGSPR